MFPGVKASRVSEFSVTRIGGWSSLLTLESRDIFSIPFCPEQVAEELDWFALEFNAKLGVLFARMQHFA